MEDKVNNYKETSLSDDQIELIFIFKFLNRNKFLIILFFLLGLLLGSFKLLTTKPTWEGEFQIVLEEENQSSLPINLESNLAELVGVSAGKDTLKTEVGILKSPLVLNNVFEFLRKEKTLKKDNSMKNLRFKTWKNNQLDIGLEKGTSILNLAYRDTDKSLLLPALSMISNNYQEYSGRKRQRNLNLGLNFFKNQIKLYKLKNIESLKNAQEFANKNDLAVLIDDSNTETINSNTETINRINVEEIRIQSANAIRNIDLQLEQIEKLNKPDDIIFFSSLVPFRQKNVSEQLVAINSEIATKSMFFTKEDKYIQDLISKRNYLAKVLKKQVLNQLRAIRVNEEAKLKAAERPEGVLIKYKMLLNEHLKDRLTLNKLESENRILMLENARSKDPWELITKPTIRQRPVAPIYTNVLLIYSILGLILGTTLSLIYERKKGLIFSTNELEALFSPFLVWAIELNENDKFDNLIKMFARGPLSKSKGEISFLINKNLNYDFIKKFKSSIKKNIKNRKLNIVDDLTDLDQSENFIFVNGIGSYTRNEVKKLKKTIQYQNFEFICMLVMEDVNITNNQMLDIKKEIIKFITNIHKLSNKLFYKFQGK